MTLRPIRLLGDRAGRFAGELRRRYARGRGDAPAVDATLVPLRRAAGRQLVLQRYTLNVAPRMRLALASAPCLPPAASARAPGDRRRDPSTSRVESVVRAALAVRELRVVELRVARAAQLAAERALRRATRIEAGAPSAATSQAASRAPEPPRLPALPPLPLVPATQPSERAMRAADTAADAELVAAEHSAWRSEQQPQLTYAASTPPSLDVERITDSVLDAIDRRVVAQRERQERC